VIWIIQGVVRAAQRLWGTKQRSFNFNLGMQILTLRSWDMTTASRYDTFAFSAGQSYAMIV
jgi:hypothetical protein